MATRIPTMYGRYYVISLVWRGRQFTFTAYRATLSKMQRPQAQRLCDKMYPGCRVISFHESDPTDGPVVLTTESKKCGEGEYFCNDEQKCKPIPKDHHVMPDGMLMKGKKHEEYDKSKNCGCGKDPCITYGKQIDPDCQVEGKKIKKKEKAIQGATDVPNFPQDQVSEGAAWTKKSGKNKEGGLNEKGRKSYERDNPGSDLKAPSKKKGNKRRASFCARMKGMRKRQKPSNNTGDDRLSKSLRAWNC